MKSIPDRVQQAVAQYATNPKLKRIARRVTKAAHRHAHASAMVDRANANEQKAWQVFQCAFDEFAEQVKAERVRAAEPVKTKRTGLKV